MPRIAYPAAILLPDHPGGAYGVIFPDLPGCVSTGTSVEDAFVQAMEALEGHLGLMVEDGDAIPQPSSIEAARIAVQADLEPEEGGIASIMLVPVAMPGRTQRFNITLDENLVAQIDRITSNRSAFLADAARAELKRRRVG